MSGIAEGYRRQVALLTRIIPFIDVEPIFALKGGTAINLFVRPMPRLSVDLDLVYLRPGTRDEALANITAALQRISARAEAIGLRVTHPSPTQLLIEDRDRTRVIVEVTPVLRGTVFEASRRTVAEAVQEQFGYAEMLLVAWEDLYAGKIIAALDRQHPRDLFDVHHLLQTEGLTRDLVRATLVYLISHHRAIHEVLAPQRKEIAKEFSTAFVGMTAEPVDLETLLSAREALVNGIHAALTDEDRAFLLSFKRCSPEWERLGIPHVADLPAVRWKLQNLAALATRDRSKHEEYCRRLEAVLRERRG